MDLCELEAIQGNIVGYDNFLCIYLMHLLVFCMCVHLRGLVGQRTSCGCQLSPSHGFWRSDSGVSSFTPKPFCQDVK